MWHLVITMFFHPKHKGTIYLQIGLAGLIK